MKTVCTLNDYDVSYQESPNTDALTVRSAGVRSDRMVVIEVGDEKVKVNAEALRKAIENCTNTK